MADVNAPTSNQPTRKEAWEGFGGWIADGPEAADCYTTVIVDFGEGPTEAHLALTFDPDHSLAVGQKPKAPVLTIVKQQ